MPYIVAFEGIDGTGKGTQMQRAAQRLTDAGRPGGSAVLPDV